jgi:hypothetical protein
MELVCKREASATRSARSFQQFIFIRAWSIIFFSFNFLIDFLYSGNFIIQF